MAEGCGKDGWQDGGRGSYRIFARCENYGEDVRRIERAIDEDHGGRGLPSGRQ